MRKKRVEIHLGWKALPKPIRPTWEEWKCIVRAFGDPKRAVVAILAQATAKLERKLGKK